MRHSCDGTHAAVSTESGGGCLARSSTRNCARHSPSPLTTRPPRTTLQENVGPALTAGLASVAAAQPDDPVEYLAHWLLKYLAIEEKKEKVSTKSTATAVHTDRSKRGLGEEDAGWEATSRCGSSGIGERRHTRRRTGRWSSSCAGC
jgi:hypothetical protein